MESGQLFFAFLALVIFFLVLVGGAREKEGHAHAAGGGGGPLIVRTKPTKFPKAMRIAVKPNWSGTSSAEDFATSLSSVLLFPLKMLVGFFRRRVD